MLIFANESHRLALEGLGLLSQGQNTIEAGELARLSLATGNLAQAIYYIRQELSHHVQNLWLMDSMLEMARDQIAQITDQISWEEASEAVTNIAKTLHSAQVFLPNIEIFADELLVGLKNSHTYPVTPDDETQINRLLEQALQLKQALLKEYVMTEATLILGQELQFQWQKLHP